MRVKKKHENSIDYFYGTTKYLYVRKREYNREESALNFIRSYKVCMCARRIHLMELNILNDVLIKGDAKRIFIYGYDYMKIVKDR